MRRQLAFASFTLLAVLPFGCGTTAPPPPPDPSACASSVALVAMSDYHDSDVASVQLDGGGKFIVDPELGTDPVISVSSGHTFLVARLEGHIFPLDACGRWTQEIRMGDTSNPQDVAVAPDGALWVPRYNVPNIAIVRGTTIAATIDLSPYDKRDGNPNASGIRILDIDGAAKAFVPLEKLELVKGMLVPTQPSSILRIDVATQTVEAEIPLAGRNPFNAPSAIAQRGNVLYLAEPGNFSVVGEDFAGIERFDAASSTTRMLVSEADLGGSALEIAIAGKCGAVLLADPSPDNKVWLATFDADTGKVISPKVLGPSDDFDTGLHGLGWIENGAVLLVGDRAGSPGRYPIHVFDRDDACTLHERSDVIFVPQKPISVKSPDGS